MSCSEQETKKNCYYEPQLLPGFGLVIRIQHFRNRFGGDLLVHRPGSNHPTLKASEVRGLDRLGFPQAQQVSWWGRTMPAQRGVERHTLDDSLRESIEPDSCS